MEGELKATRRELESTKKALKVQTARCRHLVAAFTKKLAEKDAEMRAFREQREKQLSSLLRALLVLEARLRREQKSIKVLLAEKDNIINNQKLEIERLKEGKEEPRKEIKEETKVEEEEDVFREYAKPDLISSLGISDLSKEPDSLSSESTRSCLGDESDYTVMQAKGVLNVHDLSAFSPVSKFSGSFSPISKSVPDISTGIPEGEESDKYQDNPVLQCVNQILLKDQEDFLEERSLRQDEKDPRRHAVWMDEEDSPLDEDMQEEDTNQSKKSASFSELDKDRIRINPPLPPKPKIQNKKVEFSDKPFHKISQDQLGIPLSILEPIDHGDKDLYVISNSALDDEIVKQLRGRTLDVTGLHIKPHKERNHHSDIPTGLLHPNHKPKKNANIDYNNMFTPPRSSSGVLKVSIQESPTRTAFGFKSPPKVGMPNMIKVASPVATLLTSQGAKEEIKPTVSQMVRRFEDLGIKKEEEEQKKTEKEKEEGSPGVSYDNFLEATGLSQKSIMTPSRLMTNHRNVTKPKDVKLRNKVRTTGVIERCIPPQVVGPTIKYWTEPFL